VAILIVLAIPVACWSNPYLVCDPPDPAWNITQCEVEVTRNNVTTVYPGICGIDPADPTAFRLLDLAPEPGGQYTFRARWANGAGWWSDWSDPLNAVKAGKSGNIRIK